MSYDDRMKKAIDYILHSMPNDSRKIARDIAKDADQEIEQLKKENKELKARLNAINDNCYDGDLVDDLPYVSEI